MKIQPSVGILSLSSAEYFNRMCSSEYCHEHRISNKIKKEKKGGKSVWGSQYLGEMYTLPVLFKLSFEAFCDMPLVTWFSK